MPGYIAAIDESGISAPGFAQIFQQLQNDYKAIYGPDIYIEADSQDAQLLALFARLINDANQTVIADFFSRSPDSAIGAGLSLLIKINGLRRLVPTYSSVDVTIVGQTGTVINAGAVGDGLSLGTVWVLPPTVEIPLSGEITVTAVSSAPGAINAAPNTVTNILTPVPGWQTVTNPGSAAPGSPVEADTALRARRARSTTIASRTIRESIYANVAAVNGVERLKVYENDSEASDVNGLPPHSVGVVTLGGTALDIATAIALVKSPGTGTYGSAHVVVVDSKGVPNTINYSPLILVPIYYRVTILPLGGYVSTTGQLIIDSLARHFNDMDIHESVFSGRLWASAGLSSTSAVDATNLTQAQLNVLASTFVVKSIEVGRSLTNIGINDVPIAFDETASGNSANGVLTVIT